MPAYSAPIECLSKDELVHKIHELQQALSELALQELTAQRLQLLRLDEREAAAAAQEGAIAAAQESLRKREAEVAAREEALQLREAQAAATSGAAVAAVRALCTPTPTRAAPTQTLGRDLDEEEDGSYGSGAPAEPPQPQAEPADAFQHKTTPRNRPASVGLGAGAPAAAASVPSAGVQAQPAAQQQPTTRRLSGAATGSASKLKALFEKRTSGGNGSPTPGPRAGSSGGAMRVVLRKAASPFPSGHGMTPTTSGGAGPAPKVSLQDLLQKDEERKAPFGS